MVHWYRNFSHVPSTKVREAAAMLKAINASEDIAREKAVQVDTSGYSLSERIRVRLRR